MPPVEQLEAACQYCYRKKLKCDLVSPTCGKCQYLSQPCRPVKREKRSRPTNAQIEYLQKRVRDLEGYIHSRQALIERSDGAVPLQLEGQSFGLPNGARQGDLSAPGSSNRTPVFRDESQSYSTPSISSESGVTPLSSLSKLYIHSSGHRTSHGPTSFMFDDEDRSNAPTSNYSPNQIILPSVGNPLSSQSDWHPDLVSPEDARVSERLTREASEMRHWEMVNAAEGNFQLDGVPAGLAMHLLGLHWNRQHFAYLITYRPLFMRDLACNGPYYSPLLLNAIFFSVSKFSSRPEVYDDPNDQTTAGLRFLRRFKELLGVSLDQSSIPTIQALLCLSSALFALGQQAAPWLYTGLAMRMISDLGLTDAHALTADIKTPEEMEIRRRVVWAAFVYDRILSLYQGRSITMSLNQVLPAPNFLDLSEELENWSPYAMSTTPKGYPGCPTYAVSCFSALCKLSIIMGEIITGIYTDTPNLRTVGNLVIRLDLALNTWWQRLPEHLQVIPTPFARVPPPHIMSLNCMYNVLVILLHRPFVESGHLRVADSSILTSSWERCEEAANNITGLLQCYRDTFSLVRAPFQISYANYVAATIHVRIAVQRGVHSQSGQALPVHLEGLADNARTNPLVRKTLAVIRQLMQRLGLKLDSPPIEGTSETGDGAVGSKSSSAGAADFDLDALIKKRSFETPSDTEWQLSTGGEWLNSVANQQHDLESWSNIFQQDNIFGIMH